MSRRQPSLDELWWNQNCDLSSNSIIILFAISPTTLGLSASGQSKQERACTRELYPSSWCYGEKHAVSAERTRTRSLNYFLLLRTHMNILLAQFKNIVTYLTILLTVRSPAEYFFMFTGMGKLKCNFQCKGGLFVWYGPSFNIHIKYYIRLGFMLCQQHDTL